MAMKPDHNHPLFLSSYDVVGAAQVGIQLTGMENYTLWSRAMCLNMLTRNKLGFIDGLVQRDDFEEDSEKQDWDRCNAMVISWILNNVSKDLVSGIFFCSSAHLVWTDLKERFDKVNMSRIFHLHKAIATLTQGVSPVSVYYSKLKDLWDEYDSITPPPVCGCAKSKDYTDSLLRQKLLQFLMGLNDNYSQARSQILMMNPTLSVNQCYAIIIQDESQRGCLVNIALVALPLIQLHYSHTDLEAQWAQVILVVVQVQIVQEGILFRTEACFKLLQCNYCNMKGHTRDTCYKLIRYPADFKGKKKNTVASVVPAPSHSNEVIQPHFTQDQYTQILRLLNKPTIPDSTDNSRAHNANTTGNESLLNTGLIAPNPGKVQLPTGDFVVITKSGNYQLEGGDVVHNDLFTGKVKGIGSEQNGLYTMRSSIQNEGNRYKALAVANCRE
ncbi:hypothetical protein KY285_036262 [Solanum tuberosum]|nr:hypothetical protein KY285_036262 [Solanum tuberosum]